MDLGKKKFRGLTATSVPHWQHFPHTTVSLNSTLMYGMFENRVDLIDRSSNGTDSSEPSRWQH